MKALIVCLSLFWLTSAGTLSGQPAQVSADQSLERLERAFQSGLQEIRTRHVASRQTLKKNYARNLSALEQRIVASGKLEPLLIVMKELERFAREQTVDRVAEKAPAYLQKIQKHHVKRSAELDLIRSQEIHDLASKYEQALRRLQSSYTRKGEINEALKVKAARRALPENEDVLAATEHVKAELTEHERAKQEREAVAREDVAEVALDSTPEDIPNKPTSNDKKRIGDRYETFIEAMEKRDVELMATLFRPELIDMIGTDFIVQQFLPHADGIEKARQAGVRFMTGKITFGDDGRTAVQIPYTRAFNEKTDLDPVAWVKVDGEWYWDTDDKKNGK